ncbi:mRNA export factor GLE1 isoform X1 [Quercus suber]|uniref:mRNA export factor GLE1 isoform X1 n=1 Tax=Quercus suber TaxID=58331 RepID=UPI0032DF2512
MKITFKLSVLIDEQEEIRNKISALETDLSEKYTSALTQVVRYREARCEMDRKFDTQYQQKIAEALDNHLTTVQRDHELRSQIEERRIRSDAAYEEAKRKEKASHEEKLRQEKAKAESEAGLDEAKRAALEAERRATKEAAERLASETSTRVVARVAQEDAGLQMNANAGTSSKVLWAAESALNFEQARLHKFKEVDERNQALRLTYNKDLSSYEKLIKRSINQIRRSTKVVRLVVAASASLDRGGLSLFLRSCTQESFPSNANKASLLKNSNSCFIHGIHFGFNSSPQR